MSELILVRHGQATFGAETYDKLSELGIEQVRKLAGHWRELGETFDCLYCGSLLRQRETAAELRELLRDGAAAPELDPALNEYDGDPLIRSYLRNFARAEGFDPEPEWPVRDRTLFQRLFEAAAARWIAGSLQPADDDPGFERWPDFQLRVYQALDRIMARHTGGSRVLVATSGGVIALALQRVLRFPDSAAIATNWMVQNSSVSRIKYGNGRISLMQFNSLPHLERAGTEDMITYR